MSTTLHTVPDTLEVTTESVDIWSVSFVDVLQDGETITSAAAGLFRTTVPRFAAAVTGFVTSVTVTGTAVDVAWTGSVLRAGQRYRLETRVTLNSGAVIERLTDVVCVA